VNEQQLRRHLDEAHRQLLERDKAYRFHEEQVTQLREQLAETQAWARDLEGTVEEMKKTRAWRFAVRLRSLRAGAGKRTGR
jgi:predicted RNase H-like nuclease (RuvC/YqgF family)